jgi:hypothetical protein
MRNPRADPEAAHYRGLAYPYIVNPPNAVAYRSATARVRRQAMLRPTLGDRFVNSVESSCPHCSTVSTPRGPWCAAPRPRGAASSSETAHQCIWRPSTHPKVLDAAAQGVCCHSAYELYSTFDARRKNISVTNRPASMISMIAAALRDSKPRSNYPFYSMPDGGTPSRSSGAPAL